MCPIMHIKSKTACYTISLLAVVWKSKDRNEII